MQEVIVSKGKECYLEDSHHFDSNDFVCEKAEEESKITTDHGYGVYLLEENSGLVLPRGVWDDGLVGVEDERDLDDCRSGLGEVRVGRRSDGENHLLFV